MDQELYFLTKAMYSLNEMRPLLSVSIFSKFHLTISSVMVMLRGLKVSSISFLNSLISINSSSDPSEVPVFSSLCFERAFSALSPKKWEN